MIELAQRIAAEAGHQIDYKIMPWERSVLKVRRGDFDCVVGAYKEDSPDFIFRIAPGVSMRAIFREKGQYLALRMNSFLGGR